MWGDSHSFGFHKSPWGVAHSRVRGLELVNLYALRLQSYLFQSPAASLLPDIATLAVARGLTRFDRALLWAMVLLLAAYFAYWHDGFYRGPRFLLYSFPFSRCSLSVLHARPLHFPRVHGTADRILRLPSLLLSDW
ncbi:MAG: hypothetical protein ACT4P6_05690 [Gemmatimonadaceae bacterium]